MRGVIRSINSMMMVFNSFMICYMLRNHMMWLFYMSNMRHSYVIGPDNVWGNCWMVRLHVMMPYCVMRCFNGMGPYFIMMHFTIKRS